MPPTDKQFTCTPAEVSATSVSFAPTTTYESPTESALKIIGLEKSVTKPAPTCTVSKPLETTEDTDSALTISNVFSLKDTEVPEEPLSWSDSIIKQLLNADDSDCDHKCEDVVVSDDDDSDLMRGEHHQVRAARHAAACIKRSSDLHDLFEPDLQNRVRLLPMKYKDDIDVYEVLPEVITQVDLGPYQPKQNPPCKVVYTSKTNAPSAPKPAPLNVAKVITNTMYRPSPPKMPRLAPKVKETPVVISSPTASRNVDDYIVPLNKCMSNEPDLEPLITEQFTIEDVGDTKRKLKTKSQWKSGYVRRKRRRKSSTHSDATKFQPSASTTTPVAQSHKRPGPKKASAGSAPAGYSTIRSLLNAPPGHMVTRSSSVAPETKSEAEEENGIADQSSCSGSTSPTNRQGFGAKKQLRLMLLTKGKEKPDDDAVDMENQGDAVSLQKREEELDEEDKPISVLKEELSNANNSMPALKALDTRTETDDEFKSDEEMPCLDKITSDRPNQVEQVSQAEPDGCIQKPLKVKLCRTATKPRGRGGKRAGRGRPPKRWNIARTDVEPAPETKSSAKEFQKAPVRTSSTTGSGDNPDEAETSGAEDDGKGGRARRGRKKNSKPPKTKTKKVKRKRKRRKTTEKTLKDSANPVELLVEGQSESTGIS